MVSRDEDEQDLMPLELAQRRRRSVIMAICGVPCIVLAFLVRTVPSTSRGHPFPALIVVGVFCVALGVHGIVRYTRLLRKRRDDRS